MWSSQDKDTITGNKQWLSAEQEGSRGGALSQPGAGLGKLRPSTYRSWPASRPWSQGHSGLKKLQGKGPSGGQGGWEVQVATEGKATRKALLNLVRRLDSILREGTGGGSDLCDNWVRSGKGLALCGRCGLGWGRGGLESVPLPRTAPSSSSPRAPRAQPGRDPDQAARPPGSLPPRPPPQHATVAFWNSFQPPSLISSSTCFAKASLMPPE